MKRRNAGIMRLDMRRAFFSPLFAATVILLMILLYGIRNSWGTSDLVNMIEFMMGGSSISKLVLVILPAIPYSYAYIADYRSMSSRYWTSRCGTLKYASSKFCCAVLAGMFAYILSISAVLLICLSEKPLYVGVDEHGLSFSSGYDPFLIEYNMPLLFLAVRITHNALTAGMFAGITFCVAALIPNLLVAIILPAILDFIYLRICNLLPIPRWMDQIALTQEVWDMGSPAATFFTKFGCVSAILLIAWALSYFAIRRRLMNE